MKNIVLGTNPSREFITRRIFSGFLLLALTLLLAGCESSQSTPEVEATGVYTLIGVNGQSLPSRLTHGGAPMTIKSGAFTINADGTCGSLTKFSVAGREDVTREAKATYTRQGNELTMKWKRAGTTKGQLSGNAFTMVNEGMTFEYRK